jgi:hypothetical protein
MSYQYGWLLVVAAIGNLLAVFQITTRRSDQPPDDPAAWPARTVRLSSLVVVVVALYLCYGSLSLLWSWPHSSFHVEAITMTGIVALLACILFVLVHLSRLANRAIFPPVTAAFTLLACISACCTFSLAWLPTWRVPFEWEGAARIAHRVASLLHILTWVAILLLAGRLSQRIRQVLTPSIAPVTSPPASRDLRPKGKLGWGIVLGGLLLLAMDRPVAMPSAFLSAVFDIAYACGVVLIAVSFDFQLRQKHRRLRMTALIFSAALMIGTCLNAAFYSALLRPGPLVWSIPPS